MHKIKTLLLLSFLTIQNIPASYAEPSEDMDLSQIAYDDEEDSGDESWDEDEDWGDEDEDWSDEEDSASFDEGTNSNKPISLEPIIKPTAESASAVETSSGAAPVANNIEKASEIDKAESLEKEATLAAEKEKLAQQKAAEEKAAEDKKYIQLANTFNRTKEDLERLYSQYGDQLIGLNPDNPKDLREIEKFIEIVGIPKAERKSKPQTTQKDPTKPAYDPSVNFSARNIATRDAFATLARVSGKSITVSGSIQDRDLISVVEINSQPFSQAFLSLVEAADVDFSVTGDTYTILKKNAQRPNSLAPTSLVSSDVDLSVPLDERYSDLIYDNEDLSSIIKDIANKYGVDVMMTATPTEKVTLRVRAVGVSEAFDLVFAGSQFGYTRKDDTFIVYSAANKNFSLDRKTILFPIKYLEAQAASQLLPAELKSLVQVSANQNAFIAEGSKQDLTKLYDFLRTIDKPVPQVELSVQLVEVSKGSGRKNNILQEPFTIGRLGKTKTTTVGTTSTTTASGFDLNFGPDELGILLNRPGYTQTSKNASIKVNQRLLVTSGKSAKINLDKDTNVVLNSGDSGNQGVGVVQNQRIQRITAGNSMDITPVVGGGGVITVKVEVEVSANSTLNSQGVPGETLRRRLSSEVQIVNNETIALGGLFDDSASNERSQEIPFLNKIPVIGHLFANNSKTKNLTELLILITPHIRGSDEVEEVFIQAEGSM
jgi:hypothetical protein